MTSHVRDWFERNTSSSADWELDRLWAARETSPQKVSVVIPTRNHAGTIRPIVGQVQSILMAEAGLVDELIVLDAGSSDDTVAAATDLGAEVYTVADIRPDLGVLTGRGEAIWKSQFVATGDVLVVLDPAVSGWKVHFASALMGPLLERHEVQLVKGFYDRVIDSDGRRRVTSGGPLTELLVRPLLAIRWPLLGAVVQPLAREWAIRRTVLATLPIPARYGVEFAMMIDVVSRYGLEALAQVDLGVPEAYRHLPLDHLDAMAVEILCIADLRYNNSVLQGEYPVILTDIERADSISWRERPVQIIVRPPAQDLIAPRSA